MVEIDKDDRFRLRLHSVEFAGMEHEYASQIDTPSPDPIGPHKLQVSTLAGEVVVEIDQQFVRTSRDVKEQVQKVKGIPIAEQRLFLGCKEWTEQDTLCGKISGMQGLTITLVRDSALLKKELCEASVKHFFKPPAVQSGRRPIPMSGYALWRTVEKDSTEYTWRLVKVCPENSPLRHQSMTNSRASSVQMMIQDRLGSARCVLSNTTLQNVEDMEKEVFGEIDAA
jgi:hypothetical protein